MCKTDDYKINRGEGVFNVCRTQTSFAYIDLTSLLGLLKLAAEIELHDHIVPIYCPAFAYLVFLTPQMLCVNDSLFDFSILQHMA